MSSDLHTFLNSFRRDKSLPFSDLHENLIPFVDLARLLAGFGLVTILLTVLKRNSERRSWRNFKMRVGDWLDRLSHGSNRHPKEIEPEEWKVECERMLSDSKFSPLDIDKLLDTSVIVAHGIAANKFLP